MARPDAVAAHYTAQQRQAEAALILTRRQWRLMAGDLDASWARIANRVTLIVTAAQLGAARAGAGYVPAALAEIGQAVDPVAEVRPDAWAGTASDGRPLDSLLYSSVVTARRSVVGSTLAEALVVGGAALELLVRTQVADAARGAAGAAITARPGVGWTRMVNPPCCQRCAVLAGKWFKWNAGFQRHPRCDCRHVPCRPDGFADHADQVTADQVKDLTVAQRAAVADGADLNQVVNATRRVENGGMTTSEGTTRRGLYGGYERRPDGSRRRRARGELVPRRLTPEAIYRLSTTREEALQRLRQNGYLL